MYRKKLAVAATTVLFLWVGPVYSQEKKEDKADAIIRKLTEISNDLLEMKKENEARLKAAEQEVATLKSEVANLKKAVAELQATIKKPETTEPKPEKVDAAPKVITQQKDPPPVVQAEPPKKVPVIVENREPATIKVVNTFGPATVSINGKLYKIPVGTTNIAVAPGQFTWKVYEVAGSEGTYTVNPGQEWGYKIYPLPPTIPLYVPNEQPPTVPLYTTNVCTQQYTSVYCQQRGGFLQRVFHRK